MQPSLRSPALFRRRAQPGALAGRAPRDPAGAGRNTMADRPQDFGGRRNAAVRSVQHLNPLFGDRTFAQPSAAVTRTDQQNVLRT